MNWNEIIIKVSNNDLEKAEGIANIIVPYGIYVEDYSNLEKEIEEIAHINLIDEELLKKDRDNCLIHIYIEPNENLVEMIDFLKTRYDHENINYEIKTDICKEEEWINNWKKYFKPMPVGENLLIRPIWEEIDENIDKTVINLEPGVAFGTGTHETTRLCLEMVEKYVRPGNKVLDVGCGSGILSVTSLILGASRAVAVDIDNLAVKIAKENAKLNSVEDRYEVICGNLVEKIEGKFDIILANIVAEVLINLSKDIDKYMNEDSIYIMSGIISTSLNEVKEAIAKKFMIIEEKRENDWVSLVVKLNKKEGI